MDTLTVDEKVEAFAFGLTRQYLDEGQIAVIKSDGKSSRASIDEWARIVKDTVDNWQPDKHIFVMYDLSHKNQSFTPYSRHKAEETYTYVPKDVLTFAAVILPKTIVFKLIAMFLQRRGKGDQTVVVRLFTDKEEGMRWLRKVKSGGK